MKRMKTSLFIVISLVTAAFVSFWWKSAAASERAETQKTPGILDILIGFVTNFFDMLGIGSFAPTTAAFKLGKMVDDEKIPGTLNVGHTLPTTAEAFISIAIITVDPVTLISMILASCAGSWLGAGVVAKWPRRNVQIGMGLALIVAAMFFLLKQLGMLPGDAGSLGVNGTRLIIAIAGNFVLGALMTLGIGLFAPCMVLVAMLGMSPAVAYPIMMGSCAFLMPVGSVRFIRERSYTLKSALGLTIGGVPGVLLAAFWIKSMDVTKLRWVVIVVVTYTAAMMLRSAMVERSGRAVEIVPSTGD
jgi:uncharacterized membrane protein YfcA